MLQSYIKHIILKLHTLYLLYITDINNGAYLTLEIVCKPGILCSLHMVHLYQTCYRYISNTHIYLILAFGW